MFFIKTGRKIQFIKSNSLLWRKNFHIFSKENDVSYIFLDSKPWYYTRLISSLYALIFSLLKTGKWLKINVQDLPVLLPNIWPSLCSVCFCFFSTRAFEDFIWADQDCWCSGMRIRCGGIPCQTTVIFLYLHSLLSVCLPWQWLFSDQRCTSLASALFPPLCPLRLHSCLPPANRAGSAAERQRFGRGGRAKDCGRQTTSWKRNFYESVGGKTSDMIRRVEIGWKETQSWSKKSGIELDDFIKSKWSEGTTRVR